MDGTEARRAEAGTQCDLPFLSNCPTGGDNYYFGVVGERDAQRELGSPRHNILERDAAVQVALPFATHLQPLPARVRRVDVADVAGAEALNKPPLLKDAVMAVMEGFGRDRRAKPAELVALELFSSALDNFAAARGERVPERAPASAPEPTSAPSASEPPKEPSTLLRDAIAEVVRGFGAERRAKAPELLALQAFMESCGERRRVRVDALAAASEPEPGPPYLRRLEDKIRTLPTRPTLIDLSEYRELGDWGAKRLVEVMIGHSALLELRLARASLGPAAASCVPETVELHVHVHAPIPRTHARIPRTLTHDAHVAMHMAYAPGTSASSSPCTCGCAAATSRTTRGSGTRARRRSRRACARRAVSSRWASGCAASATRAAWRSPPPSARAPPPASPPSTSPSTSGWASSR